MLECWLRPAGQGLTGLLREERAWVHSAEPGVHEEQGAGERLIYCFKKARK